MLRFNTNCKIIYVFVLLLGTVHASFGQTGPAEEAASGQFKTQVYYLPYADRLIAKVEKRGNAKYGMDAVVTKAFLDLSVERRSKIADELQGMWYDCLKDNKSKINHRKWASLMLWDSSGRCVANTVNNQAPYLWIRDDVGDARKAKAGQKVTYTYTPKPGSKERKDILDALRKPIKVEAKGDVIFKVNFFKVSRGWTFLKVDVLMPEKSGKPFLWGKVSALLRKQGSNWKELIYGWDTDANTKEAVISSYPDVPRSILP